METLVWMLVLWLMGLTTMIIVLAVHIATLSKAVNRNRTSILNTEFSIAEETKTRKYEISDVITTLFDRTRYKLVPPYGFSFASGGLCDHDDLFILILDYLGLKAVKAAEKPAAVLMSTEEEDDAG